MDPVGAITTYLRADADVSALVPSRVFSGQLPDSIEDGMPVQTVLVSLGPGEGVLGSAQLGTWNPRVTVDCYGRNFRETQELFVAVRKALKSLSRQPINDTMIVSVTSSGDGVQAVEPDTNWPIHTSTFVVLVREP